MGVAKMDIIGYHWIYVDAYYYIAGSATSY